MFQKFIYSFLSADTVYVLPSHSYNQLLCLQTDWSFQKAVVFRDKLLLLPSLYCDMQAQFQATPEIRACNNRTRVARGVFYVVRIYTLLGKGPINTHYWQHNTVYSLGPVLRSYLQDNRRYKQLSWELRVQLRIVNPPTTEAEEYPLLRFVTRKRLVRTRQRNSN
jgi:hypothetical protein